MALLSPAPQLMTASQPARERAQQAGTPRRRHRPAWITVALVSLILLTSLWPQPWPVSTTPGGHRITHVVLEHAVVPNESPVLRFRFVS